MLRYLYQEPSVVQVFTKRSFIYMWAWEYFFYVDWPLSIIMPYRRKDTVVAISQKVGASSETRPHHSKNGSLLS